MSSSFIHVVASRFHSKWPLDHSELASQACPFEDATWAGSQRATPNAEPDAVNLHLPGTNELLPGTSCEADGRVYYSRPMRSLSIACVMTSTSPTDMTCWEIASNNFWKFFICICWSLSPMHGHQIFIGYLPCNRLILGAWDITAADPRYDMRAGTPAGDLEDGSQVLRLMEQKKRHLLPCCPVKPPHQPRPRNHEKWERKNLLF